MLNRPRILECTRTLLDPAKISAGRPLERGNKERGKGQTREGRTDVSGKRSLATGAAAASMSEPVRVRPSVRRSFVLSFEAPLHILRIRAEGWRSRSRRRWTFIALTTDICTDAFHRVHNRRSREDRIFRIHSKNVESHITVHYAAACMRIVSAIVTQLIYHLVRYYGGLESVGWHAARGQADVFL